MCIDNETQYVVAVVGGRSKNDPYNRAFLSTRQPGSSIKPLLDYGPAIDNGVINGSTVMTDQKVYWDDYDKKSYSPSNSGGIPGQYDYPRSTDPQYQYHCLPDL